MSQYKYSNEEIARALWENNGLVTNAAEAIGCDPKTIYNRMREEPLVRQARQFAEQSMTETAQSKLYKAIEREESWAIKFHLQNRSHLYSDKKKRQIAKEEKKEIEDHAPDKDKIKEVVRVLVDEVDAIDVDDVDTEEADIEQLENHQSE